MLFGGCSAGSESQLLGDRPRTYRASGAAGSGSVASSGPLVGGASNAGTAAISLISLADATGAGPCEQPPTQAPLFGDSRLSNSSPARRELFTWTTVEQAAEIRAGAVLLTRTEREGLGPGYAMDVLAEQVRQAPDLATAGAPSVESERTALLEWLTGPRFSKARYAWSEPWATRMGWPGETYGNQLVRILLRPEAWLARYVRGQLDVVDMRNANVPLADVLAHPERLAGVFFVKDVGAGGPSCGSFQGGNNGYREFIIGNEGMIEEWSLGTSELRSRLQSDIAQLETFFARARACPEVRDPKSWNAEVVCSDWKVGFAEVNEIEAYEGALAMPSPGYLPAPGPLAELIETLKADLFEPSPYVVRPAP